MNIFKGPNVDAIRKEYGLTEENYFKSGSSAEIYCNGNTVFRLSTDCSSHYLTVIGNEKGWAVPKLYSDYGAVKESDESPEWDYYWLGEFEKLNELSTDALLEKEFADWLYKTLEHAGLEEGLIYEADFPVFREALGKGAEDTRFTILANTLIAMTKVCDGEMDMSVSNFMLRSNTNEILVVDPAHGMRPCM